MIEGLQEATTEEEAEDAIPKPVPDAVVSRAGDLWVLGEHRVICADSVSG